MKFVDRLLTIVITATLVSAGWIIFGGTLMQEAGERSAADAEIITADANAGDPGGLPEEPSLMSEDASSEPGTEAPGLSAPDAQPAGEASPDLIIPVEDVAASELTDSFFDERGNGARRHEAIDIMAEEGRAVVAATPGTIAKLHRSGPGGNSIYVRSADRGTIYYYAHLAQYASGLREGQRVRAGQRLGTVGSSGNADPSAPHLHFAILETTPDAEWWEPANAVNPFPLLRETGN